MFPEERKQKIIDLVNEKKSVKVVDLSQLMGISEVTIRRDLEELSQQNFLVRTHGGAIATYSVGNEVTATELIHKNTNADKKRCIAAMAYSLINEKDTIFTDGSSTVHELIKLIATGAKKDLRVLTTSFTTVSLLSETQNAKLIMLGGEVRFRHNHVEGYLNTEAIKSLRADKCFIGINGIDESYGYSTPRFSEAEQKSEMLRSSIKSFILADETKFGTTYLAKLNAECDYIITNDARPGYNYDWLEEHCTVLFADGYTTEKLGRGGP